MPTTTPPSNRFHLAARGAMLSLAQRSEGATEVLTVEGDQRLALLERSYKGEHVELEIVADTYAQGDDIENRNDVAFSEDALRHLAQTAAGTPFQRDHSLNSDDSGGMALGAELVEQDGVFRLRERLHLVTPWAVRAALQGTMAKFSISVVTPWADMFCSCGAQILECDHFPGEDTSEHGRIIWIHRSAEWVERSWVVRPAVPNTGILAWESLAEARTQARNQKPPAMPRPAADKRYNVNELLKLLKLDAAAGEQMITEKVRATLSELEGVRAQVTDLKTELETNTKELEQARAELADVRAKELDGEAETEVKALLADGRIRAGGKQEELVRTRYKAGDIAGARALVAALKENPRIAPVGARQSAENSTASAAGSASDTKAAVDYKAAFAALPEHIRFGARAYAENPQRFFEIRPDLLPGAGN